MILSHNILGIERGVPAATDELINERRGACCIETVVQAGQGRGDRVPRW